MLRDWGAEKKYHHVLKGYNFRLEGIQGAVLRVKLRHLEEWTEARRRPRRATTTSSSPAAACRRRRRARTCGTSTTSTRSARPTRAAWQEALHAQGIQTGIHYPIPVHLLPAYADLGYKAGDFPHSERAANEVLSLPMFPELQTDQQRAVIEACSTWPRDAVAVPEHRPTRTLINLAVATSPETTATEQR